MPNPSLVIVLITVVINMMGVGLAWPIYPLLVKDLTGGTVSQVAVVYGAIAIVFSIMQFVVAPLMGILSDRYGRKPVMLVSLAALGVDYVFLALAPTIFWVFVARMIGGAFAATMAIANAYVADTTLEKDRARGFGLVGAAFGIGFVIGPLVGGLLGEIDLRLPFWFAAMLAFANVIFGIFFLKESLPPKKRRPRSWRNSNPYTALRWIFSTPALTGIAVILLISTTMQRGLESVWVLFTQYRYGWGMADAGLSLAVVGLSYIIVQGLLVGPIVNRLGEVKTIIYGMILSSSMYLLLAFNSWGLLSYFGIIPNVLGTAIAGTAIQTLASKNVDPTEQGYLQGAISAIIGLAAIFGPLMSNSSFAWVTSANSPINFPGAYFILGGIMLLFTANLARRLR